MTVHCIHIFDRRGKTLYTKTYSQAAAQQQQVLKKTGVAEPGGDVLDEQRKLVFGMLFSLRELIGGLTPEGQAVSLNSIKTGSSTVHNYETLSGMRFALYIDNNNSYSGSGGGGGGNNSIQSSNNNSTSSSRRSSGSTHGMKGGDDSSSIRAALKHIYSELWVENVVRSPLYRLNRSNPNPNEPNESFDIKSTNFEKKLDAYLASMPWFHS